jgi:uncharacterized protein (TIGR03437 family)
MKSVLRNSALLIAMACSAVAQQSPFLSVPVTPVTGVTPVMLPDWTHNMMYVVSQSSILPVSVPDGTVGNTIALPSSATTPLGGGKQSAVGACIDPTTGTIATVAQTNSQSGATTIQVIDPTTGQIKTYQPPVDQFNVGGGCVFSQGLLYAGTGLSFMYAGNVAAVAAFDPATGNIITNWPQLGVGAMISIAASSTGKVYALSQYNNAVCAVAANCPAELDALNSDGTYAVIAQWTRAIYTSSPTFVAPNGYVYIGGEVFGSNGQQINLTVTDTWSGSAVFPSPDPWYAYGTIQGNLIGLNVATNTDTTVATMTGQTYVGIAAKRQSDGTDLVVTERNGFLDFYRITPPQIIHFIANAGLFETSSFVPASSASMAPGSLITIYGQGLGGLNEFDVADTTKIVTQLGNTQVLINDEPIQLLFVGYNQVNAALPRKLSDGQVGISVKNGSTTVSRIVTIMDQSIADFMWSPDPKNPAATQPIITNESYQLIGDPALSPAYAQANPGDALTFWATGGGLTSPSLDDSIAVVPTNTLYHLLTTPQVLVDGSPVPVIYAGESGGSVFGLNQVNCIVPFGLSSGKHDVTLGNVLYKGGLWVK